VLLASWGLGWDTFVALGTLALAVATGGLAFVTWKLSDSASAEARGQVRPVLVPGIGRGVVGNPKTSSALLHTDRRLFVNIRNVGTGPALFVRVALEPTGNSPSQGPIAVMAAGDEMQLEFAEPDPQVRWQVLLDYRDVAGRAYATAIMIESTPELRFYDVRVHEDRRITSHGDALPQAGVTDYTR